MRECETAVEREKNHPHSKKKNYSELKMNLSSSCEQPPSEPAGPEQCLETNSHTHTHTEKSFHTHPTHMLMLMEGQLAQGENAGFFEAMFQ